MSIMVDETGLVHNLTTAAWKAAEPGSEAKAEIAFAVRDASQRTGTTGDDLNNNNQTV